MKTPLEHGAQTVKLRVMRRRISLEIGLVWRIGRRARRRVDGMERGIDRKEGEARGGI